MLEAFGASLTRSVSLLLTHSERTRQGFGSSIITGAKSAFLEGRMALCRSLVHVFWDRVLAASPNAAHYALARFSMEQFRNTVAPGSTFTLITQNVDGLSRRALDEVLSQTQSASPAETTQPYVLEMHGRLMEVLCTSQQCMHRENNISSPICPALAGTEQILELADRQEPEIPVEDLPRCSKCGSLARPGVVWFEERPWHLDEIGELVQKADLCLVVGTSSTVSETNCIALP